jgi:hypothetical protein
LVEVLELGLAQVLELLLVRVVERELGLELELGLEWVQVLALLLELRLEAVLV